MSFDINISPHVLVALYFTQIIYKYMKNTRKRLFRKCAKEKARHKHNFHGANRPKTTIIATRVHWTVTQPKAVGGGATQGAAAPGGRPTLPDRLCTSILVGALMLPR